MTDQRGVRIERLHLSHPGLGFAIIKIGVHNDEGGGWTIRLSAEEGEEIPCVFKTFELQGVITPVAGDVSQKGAHVVVWIQNPEMRAWFFLHIIKYTTMYICIILCTYSQNVPGTLA